MQLFLLGAGRPASGNKPTALKNIALNTKAMDWQLHSFESVVDFNNIHFLGGYHVEDVKISYPHLNISFIPDWENNTALHTLLKAPFTNKPVFVAYSDTVFRNTVIKQMSEMTEDVIFGIDTAWKDRYEARSESDMRMAETIEIDGIEVEFTGLMKYSAKAAQLISDFDELDIGHNLIDLINYLKSKKLTVKHYDVNSEWAEFNSPRDIAHFILGTKAETLARLEPVVCKSYIGRQVSFTSYDWKVNSQNVLNNIFVEFNNEKLVIRSSSKGEDNWFSSNAGGFESLLNIDASDRTEVRQAIETVIASYGSGQNGDDQVLIQPFLSNVRASGVIFTCGLESGSPYYRFNFDDQTQSTESVTAGTHSDLRTVIVSRLAPEHLQNVAPELVPVMDAMLELELLLGYDKLDVEFAIDDCGVVHIFQVRPITVNHANYDVDVKDVDTSINYAIKCFESQQAPSSFVYGEQTIFANMPDWNPAEIIGTRPKPLAFSLYRHLITNDVWAQQRAEFGYRDVQPHPLILSLSGQPYVDARASLNSFIPSTLSEESSERLANAYINILADNPKYHDKIEFDVAFTVWTYDFKEQARSRLLPYGVTESDIDELEDALKNLTCNALVRLDSDISSIKVLKQRRHKLENSYITSLDKAYALLDDCKRYGTLAFSHAARAGFVATTLLKAFVATNVLSEERKLQFLKSFDTVAGDFEREKYEHACGKLTLTELVEKYGHLRQGTYEVATQAYWENPTKYITSNKSDSYEESNEFLLTSDELVGFNQMLNELGSDISADNLVEYIKSATQAREFVKFEFTRNLSKALDYIIELGTELEISRDDLSYFEYNDLEQLKVNATVSSTIIGRIKQRKIDYAVTCSVELPSLIKNKTDFYCFERLSSQPNFVTINKAEGGVHNLEGEETSGLKGKIVLIPQADPGFDWLFGNNIAGLITQYGGANSHMAIRAAEIGLPAAIGVGDKLYEKISSMKRLELDCANQVIREIT